MRIVIGHHHYPHHRPHRNDHDHVHQAAVIDIHFSVVVIIIIIFHDHHRLTAIIITSLATIAIAIHSICSSSTTIIIIIIINTLLTIAIAIHSISSSKRKGEKKDFKEETQETAAAAVQKPWVASLYRAKSGGVARLCNHLCPCDPRVWPRIAVPQPP